MKYVKGFFQIFFKLWSLKSSILLGGFFPLIWFLNSSTTFIDANSARFYHNMNESGIYPALGRFYDSFYQFFLHSLEFADITAFLSTIILIGSFFALFVTSLLMLRCFFAPNFEEEVKYVLSLVP